MSKPAFAFPVSAVLALALCALPAQAEPAEVADAVGRLLADKGLADGTALDPSPVPSSTKPSLGRHVRDAASEMVMSAMSFLGVRYKRGGNSSDAGFDCSGFTRHLFESSLGLLLPRRVDEQAKAPGLVQVKREELKPGDLVFFNTLRRTFSHVGVYVGDGKFIHAPRAGGEIRVESMGVRYWAKRFTGARRAAATGALVAETAKPGTLAATSEAPTAAAPDPYPY